MTALIVIILLKYKTLFLYWGQLWRQLVTGYQTIKLSSRCTDNIIKLIRVEFRVVNSPFVVYEKTESTEQTSGAAPFLIICTLGGIMKRNVLQLWGNE